MSIGTRIVQGAAAAASHPDKTISVNGTEKVVGGGGVVNWRAAGNMLTSTAPVGVNGWSASAKDHIIADPSELVAYAVALNDPTDQYEVVVTERTGPVSAHPTATATAPAGYVMVGGGCKVNWRTDPAAAGSLLTASFPASSDTWECRAKDHEESSPASVTAYAVAIRPRDPRKPMPKVHIDQETGAAADHPQALVRPSRPNYVVTGGGARTDADYSNGAAGQLLTRSAPLNDGGANPIGWTAAAKDHITASPGTVTAFVVSADLAATSSADSIDDYVRGIAPLPRPSTRRDPAREEDMSIDGITYKLRQEAVELVKNTSELKLFDGIPGTVIWPGAILRAKSVDNGTFQQVSLPRAAGRIFITDVVPGNPGPIARGASVPDPDFATVNQAKEDVLTALNPVGSAGKLIFDGRTASQLDEALVKLGVSFKPEAFTFDVRASFDSSHKSNTAIIQAVQRFYSVAFLPDLGGAGAFFAPSVTIDDVKREIGPNDPPVYISMVHYGRILHVVVESQASKTNFSASVEAAITALNGGGSLSGQNKNIMDASRLRIVEKGGSGASIAELFGTGSFEDRVNNYVKSGANFSLTNRGAPIEVELTYLGTRDHFAVALATKYNDALSLSAPDVSGTVYITDGWRPHGGPQSTGVKVAAGDKIVVRAEGKNWSGHLFTDTYDADGHPQSWFVGDPLDTTGFPLPDDNPFCLIAGFDQTDWVFAGKHRTLTAKYVGQGPRTLWFATNDINPYDGDNARKFTVNYTVVRRTAESLGYNGLGRSSDI